MCRSRDDPAQPLPEGQQPAAVAGVDVQGDALGRGGGADPGHRVHHPVGRRRGRDHGEHAPLVHRVGHRTHLGAVVRIGRHHDRFDAEQLGGAQEGGVGGVGQHHRGVAYVGARLPRRQDREQRRLAAAAGHRAGGVVRGADQVEGEAQHLGLVSRQVGERLGVQRIAACLRRQGLGGQRVDVREARVVDVREHPPAAARVARPGPLVRRGSRPDQRRAHAALPGCSSRERPRGLPGAPT